MAQTFPQQRTILGRKQMRALREASEKFFPFFAVGVGFPVYRGFSIEESIFNFGFAVVEPSIFEQWKRSLWLSDRQKEEGIKKHWKKIADEFEDNFIKAV